MEGSGRRSSYFDGDDAGLGATELRLGLPGAESSDSSKPIQTVARPNNKRAPPEDADNIEAKAQVVGWPPVRSHRRNAVLTRRPEARRGAVFVKVSMDGAPYLRKMDLNACDGYMDLRVNLEGMFDCFSLGEHVMAYEDKDGDWMMVGDVPWELFISACKRLRIMRGYEARGFGSNE